MNSMLPGTEETLNKEHLEVLASLSEDDPKSFILDLYDTFKNSWEETRENIKTACETKDSASLRKAVHLLNGSSANLGMNRLCLLCRNIETEIHENTFAAYDECTSCILEEYARSTKELEDFMDAL